MIKKKTFLSFILLFAVLTAFFLILLHSANLIDQLFLDSALLALGLTSVNFLLGILSILIGKSGSDKVFLLSLFGGILVRLIFLLVLIILVLNFLEISRNNFIFLILIFYLFYLTIEIIYLNLKE